MSLTNQRVTLRQHAEGELTADVFQVVEQPVRELEPGEALVANIYATVDPSQSRQLRTYKNYKSPFEVGSLIRGFALGQVVKSRDPAFREGDFLVHFQGGWETHSIIRPLPPGGMDFLLQPVDPQLGPLPAINLGLLATKGFPAWVGIKTIGKTSPGETVVVSGAAGAVGMTAGQLAKIYGGRVVGIAGGSRKTAYLVAELGFDDAIDYRAADFEARFDQACPEGIDVYFENVGGAVGAAAMERMRVHGRFAICGLVAEYGCDTPPPGPNLFVTIRRGFLIHGFLATHFPHQYAEFREEMIDHIGSGRIKAPFHVVAGLENAGQAMVGMLHGENLGQQILQIAEDPCAPGWPTASG